MRKEEVFSVSNLSVFKKQLMQWVRKNQVCIILDSNQHQTPYSSFELIVGTGVESEFISKDQSSFEGLQLYKNQIKDWCFGYMSYDLKNEIENLTSQNTDYLEFPKLYFFQPQKLFFIRDSQVIFSYTENMANTIKSDYQTINEIIVENETTDEKNKSLCIQSRLTREEYIASVKGVQEHIKRGNIYEANFCQEFFAENAEIKPFTIFKKLNAISKAPFASYFRNHSHYLMCSSPERYLKRTGEKVISQPIKGTAKRGKNQSEDDTIISKLKNDLKERSENIMIVDLVRNDLSKVAKRASVKVEELCQIYTFSQVHQMISTISAKVEPSTDSTDIITATFPMGSMTGAPKLSAMQIIDDFENYQRGLYSGAVGYFTPEDDFDFNVVIRSILYNEEKKYVSFSVGSAITAKANPEYEYEECLLKAKAMRLVLENNQ